MVLTYFYTIFFFFGLSPACQQVVLYIDDSMQNRHNSIANTLLLPLFCITPSCFNFKYFLYLILPIKTTANEIMGQDYYQFNASIIIICSASSAILIEISYQSIQLIRYEGITNSNNAKSYLQISSIHPSLAEFDWRDINIYLHILLFLNIEMIQEVWLQDNDSWFAEGSCYNI